MEPKEYNFSLILRLFKTPSVAVTDMDRYFSI